MLRNIFISSIIACFCMGASARGVVSSPPFPSGHETWAQERQSCMAEETEVKILLSYRLQNIRGSDYAEATYVKRFFLPGQTEPFAVAIRVREIRTPNGRQGITERMDVYVTKPRGWTHFNTRVDDASLFQQEMWVIEQNIPNMPRGKLAECMFRIR